MGAFGASAAAPARRVLSAFNAVPGVSATLVEFRMLPQVRTSWSDGASEEELARSVSSVLGEPPLPPPSRSLRLCGVDVVLLRSFSAPAAALGALARSCSGCSCVPAPVPAPPLSAVLEVSDPASASSYSALDGFVPLRLERAAELLAALSALPPSLSDVDVVAPLLEGVLCRAGHLSGFLALSDGCAA